MEFNMVEVIDDVNKSTFLEVALRRLWKRRGRH